MATLDDGTLTALQLVGRDLGGYVQTVLGTVRAYRAWVWRENGLNSTTYSTSLVPSALPYKAECWRGLGQRSTHHIGTVIPADGCRCGFYAVYYGGVAGLMAHITLPNPVVVVGSVLMSGKTVLGSRGILRAEKMQLEAFMRPFNLEASGELVRSMANYKFYVGTGHTKTIREKINGMQYCAAQAAARYKMPLLDEDDFVAECPLDPKLAPPPAEALTVDVLSTVSPPNIGAAAIRNDWLQYLDPRRIPNGIDMNDWQRIVARWAYGEL